MATGFESNRKINLIDMLPLLLLKTNLPCYIRAEIKKYEPRPYLMGDHLLPTFYKYRAKAHVEKIPLRAFHSLRRAFETTLVSKGVSMETASRMLGHKGLA